MHQHRYVNPWFMMLANIIDTLFLFSLIIFQYWLLMAWNQDISQPSSPLRWYIFLCFSLADVWLLFFIIPIFNNAKSIGLTLCKMQILNRISTPNYYKNSFKNNIILVLRRHLLSLWFFTILILIFLITINNEEIYLLSQKKQDLNNKLIIIKKILETISGIWLFLGLSNYLILLITNGKFSVINALSQSIVCYQKHYDIAEKVNSKILVPIKINNEKYYFYNDQNN